MKCIRIIVSCGAVALNDCPMFAVIDIDESDIERIQACRDIAATNDLSETRFNKDDIDYPDGDYDFCTPEAVITEKDFWISTLFSALEIEAPVETQAVPIDDLLEAFSSAQHGDLVILQDDTDQVTTELDENCEDWGLDRSPIGYQVAHKGGEHWNGRPSFELLNYKTAREEYESARAVDPDWELWTLYPGDVEQPTFA